MDLISELREHWMVIFLIIPIALIIAAFSLEKTVKAEILIPKDAHFVWAVIVSTGEYEYWNPAFLLLSGSLKEGSMMQYRWQQVDKKAVDIKSKVIKIEENKLLHQRGGTAGILTFDHQYQLIQEQDATLVIQTETYRGLGLLFWDVSQMQPVYEQVNQALSLPVLSLHDPEHI